MSRVSFFVNRGAIIHRIYFAKKMEYKRGEIYPEDLITVCTGYSPSNGEYEYISMTGISKEDLTDIVDKIGQI